MISIGVDLGGTNIKVGLVEGLKIIATRKFLASSDESMSARLPEIKVAVDQLLLEQQVNGNKISGIGLTFPSIVDNVQKKILHQYVKFSNADEIDFEAWARDSWGIPLALENDARAALVGEWQFGAGKGFNHLVMLTLGTGVGSGVLLDGKLVRGAHHLGGNLGGHTVINVNGAHCNCGSMGCVETEASGWVVHEKYENHPLYAKSDLSREDKINYRSVFTLAQKGDALAIIIRDHSLKTWAANALNFVHHFDPEILILGGGIMHSASQITPFVQEFIDQNAWLPRGTVQVVAAAQADYAGVLGMGYLAHAT